MQTITVTVQHFLWQQLRNNMCAIAAGY